MTSIKLSQDQSPRILAHHHFCAHARFVSNWLSIYGYLLVRPINNHEKLHYTMHFLFSVFRYLRSYKKNARNSRDCVADKELLAAFKNQMCLAGLDTWSISRSFPSPRATCERAISSRPHTAQQSAETGRTKPRSVSLARGSACRRHCASTRCELVSVRSDRLKHGELQAFRRPGALLPHPRDFRDTRRWLRDGRQSVSCRLDGRRSSRHIDDPPLENTFLTYDDFNNAALLLLKVFYRVH